MLVIQVPTQVMVKRDGYDVTMVRDATASLSDEEMHAALDVNIPHYAAAVVTADEIVGALSSLESTATRR